MDVIIVAPGFRPIETSPAPSRLEGIAPYLYTIRDTSDGDEYSQTKTATFIAIIAIVTKGNDLLGFMSLYGINARHGNTVPSKKRGSHPDSRSLQPAYIDARHPARRTSVL